MANKNDVTRIPLDGLLNLNKYRSDIKQFEGFNKKNSPIYGGVLSPLYEEKQTINENEKTVLVNDDKYSLVKDYDDLGCTLYKNGKVISSYINTNITKKSIKVPYNVLAFERDEENPNYIDMFVEGALSTYEIKRYNINTNEFEDLIDTYISIGKISKVEMRYGFIVFYDFDLKRVIILRKGKDSYRSFNWTFVTENNLVDKLIFTINKLKSTFDHEGQSRYILSYYGLQFDDNNSMKIGYGNKILTLDNSDSGFTASKVTLKSKTDSSLDFYQIPTFAIYSTEEDVTFYNVFVSSMNDHNGLYYLSATANSYDETNKILYVDCKNPITLNNSIPSKSNNRTASLEANTYFYSILLKTNVSSMTNGKNCLNHHVLFDSTRNYFIGNCGYIPNNNGTQSVPYGFRVNASTYRERDFAYLINYGSITNISVCFNHEGMGNTLAEWNFIDNDVIPKAYDTCCLYKISNENTINLIQVKKEIPDMEVLFNRYIVVKTHQKHNIIDTSTTSFYHGFVDYNNRVIPCEKYGDTSIANFPFGASDEKPYLSATLTDYLYASAVNANMEVSKINISSIQYNPFVINQGCHTDYDIEESSYGSSSLQDYPSVYLSDDNRALVPNYYCSFIYRNKYVDESLRDIPYPVTTNGNILYSANMFSEIINSYSNRDMIINDTVAYPLLYINNQPSFSFYFLNGIEGTNSAFILHGMNYVNTDDFIFSVTYNGDTISNTEAIISIKGFRFLGNTTKVAFFYSELKKSVYAFYGDRTLEKLYDCTEIKNIKHTFFNPINYNIYIATDDYIYVIDDDTVYRIEISGTKSMNFSDRFIYVYAEDNLYILSYEKPSESYLFNTLNTFKKIPIKLETQLYGVGNNIKSVVDCIYLRLFNDDIVEQGTLKLSVKTLTDKGESTEEKAFTINASDWDKESNTFYIRYQPKNQECLGMSVNIVSDFAIADFDIGYSTDGTIQVSKYNV